MATPNMSEEMFSGCLKIILIVAATIGGLLWLGLLL
jgi:hypothetical protein